MSNVKNLAEGSGPTPSVNNRFDRNPKVDIKEIRKKFENLSKMSDTKMNSETNTGPIAPQRRRKLSNDIKMLDSLSFSDIKLQTSVSNDPVPKSNASSSIKEKSKMFESPVETDKVVPNSRKLSKSNLNRTVSTSVNNIRVRNGCENIACDKVTVSNMVTPPAKPPRCFASAEKTLNRDYVISRKGSLSDVKVKDTIISSCPPQLKPRNSSFTFECKSGEQDLSNSKPNSASEIVGDSSKKMAKSVKFSGKTQTIFSYFKNISTTANNICEKVKQKQSNIFVDLTPTTVSPPKHYGTLKRSLSEEHIYAEPIAVCKADSKKSENQVVKPLHYMCTSLIPPALPHRDKGEDNKAPSRQSVRNMIYGSFASLRAAPKENSENISNAPSADASEADVSLKAIQARIIYVKSVRKQVSSSSICLAPKLYEALFIVNVAEDQPLVTHTFPLKVAEEYNVPLLPHICFPDSSLWKSVSVYHSETFHFTLMDKDETIYGYCLRIQGWPETGYANEALCVKVPVAVCILSSFSAPVFYKKLLLEIEKRLTLPRNSCFKYIRSLQKFGVPNAGASLSIPDFPEINEEADRVIISRPLDSHFVGIEMTRTLQFLDVDILVKCIASLFLERRILFFSALTSRLYDCCKAVSSLLYPFEWPHEIVPVLPACLTIHCCSEKPYILGIVNNNCHSMLELLAEQELLIIDVDKGAVIKSCKDEDTILPKKVQKAVMSALNLAKNMTDPTEMLRDIMISEASVHMSVEMIGHYENHFTEVNGNITFQKEAFLKNSFSYNIRSFLQWFSETQMFDSFIENSLWRMKYRNICQTNMRTFFEKRVDEYKWELSHDNEKLSRIIGKTVRNFGEMLKGLKKN